MAVRFLKKALKTPATDETATREATGRSKEKTRGGWMSAAIT